MSPNITNSTTVDERVVEMRIDNSKFEDGAKKTIGILEKLDKALHLHAETDEIDKLSRSMGNFDVSPMANGLDSLKSHFSALEIVGMRVISNLTDSVYNFTTRTIKSLSIDQVTAGWDKYAEKTSAVQTIMAATRKDIGTIYANEEEQMAAVNEQMEKLNWFTDETSYSFLDMVNNIGKFTSNGRALEESVTAMMGISTWAAISGAKVQEAGRAMYNLSQALGTGSVQVRDWMSIENANMATYEFKQMVIETAEALGTLQKRSDGVWEDMKGNEVTIEGFRENLKDDWFTSDVLLETLQNYGTFTEALRIATEETDTTATEFLRAMERYENGYDVDSKLIPWIEKLSVAEFDLGRRAFQAAQEAKTFQEAIDATKDAVSTGWMNTFEIIFGDYKTAKGFWTDVANDLWDIFASGGENRNTLLEVAFGDIDEQTNRGELFRQSLLNLLDLLITIKETIGTAFDNVFGTAEERGEVFGQMIEHFHNFTEQIGFSDEALIGLRKIIELVLSGVKLLGQIGGAAFSLLWRIIWPIANTIDDIFAMIGKSDFNAQNLFKSIELRFSEFAPVVDALGNAFGLLFSCITQLIGLVGGGLYFAFSSLLGIAGPVGDAVQFIADKFATFTNGLQRFGNYLKEGFKRNGFLGAFEAFFTGLRIEVKTTFPQLYGWFTRISDFFKNSQASISEFFSNFNLFENLPSVFQSGLIGLGGLFSVVLGGILTLITGVLQGLQGVNFDTEKISESFNNFYEIVKLIFNGLFGDPTEFKERITNFVLEAWSGFKAALEQISIRDAIKALRLSFLFAIGAKIMSVLSMVKKIGDEAATIPESLSWSIKRGGKMLEDIGKSFQANALIKMAAAVIMVSMALYGLSKINEDKLAHAAAVISIVMIILTMLVNSTRKATVLKNVDIKKFQVFGTVGSALIGLGVAIAAFTYAVFKIANAENPQRLAIAAGAILVLIGIITAVISVFATKLVKSNANWERLKNIGMIMSRLGGAFISISISIGMLVLPILSFTAAAAILEKNQLSADHVWFAAIAVMGLIMALGLAVSMIMKSMETLDDNQIKNAGGALLRIGGSIAIMSLGLNMFMIPFFALAGVCVALVAFGVDLAPVWDAFKMFGLIFVGLAGFVTVITAILTKKTMSPERIKALGQTLLRMSASVALVAIGMNKMVNAFLKVLIVASVLKKFNMEVDFATAAWTLTGIAAGILGIVYILAKISTMKGLEPKRLLALAAIITALGVAFLFLTPAIIGLGAVIAILVYFASSLKNFDAVVKNMSKLAGTLLKISGAAILFGLAMLSLGVGTLAASISIGILAVAFLAVVKAIDLLAVHQDAIFAFFKALKSYFTVDNIWTVTKMTIVLSGFIILLLALTKRLKQFAIAWKAISKGGSIGEKLSSSLGKFGQNIPKLLHGAFTKATTYLTAHADDIIPALGVIITIIGGYLTGLIPTMAEQLVVATVSLLSSFAASITAHRQEISQAISDVVNTVLAIAGDVVKDVFFNGESWKEGGIGGAILRILAGLFLSAKVVQAITSIAKFVGGLFGAQFGKKVATEMAAEVTGGYVGKHLLKESAAVMGETAGAAAKTGFLASFGTIAALIGAELAAVGGGIWLRHAGDKKVADAGLANIVTEQTKQGLSEIEAYINTINDLLNAQVLITNINDEDIDEQDMDRALRRNNEALKIAYDNLATALGITSKELKDQIAMYGDVTSAVDAHLQKEKEIAETIEQEKKRAEEAQSALQDIQDGEIKIESKVSLDESSSSLLNSLKELLDGLGESTSLFGGDLKGTLQGIIDSIVASAREQYPDLTREGLIQKVTEGLNSYTSDIGLDLSQFGDVSGMITSAIDKAIPQVSEITNKASNVVSRIVIVNDELGEMQDELEASIKHLHSRRKLIGEGSVTAFAGPLLESLTRDDNDDAYIFSQLASSSPIERKARTELASLIEQIDDENTVEGLIGLYNNIQKNIETYTSKAREFYNAYEQFLKSDEYLSALALDDDGQLSEQLIAANGNFDKYLEEIDNAAYNFAQLQALQKTLNGTLVECAEEYKQAEQYYNKLSADPNADSDELQKAYNNLQASIKYYNEIKGIMDGLDLGTELSLFDENSPILSIQKAENNPELDEATKSLAQKIQNGISTGLTENSSVVDGGVNSTIDSLLGNLQSAWEAKSPEELFNKLAQAIPNGIINAIKQNSSNAVNTIVTLMQHMQVPFQNIQLRFQNFGVQAVRGVVIGINNNVNAAYNAGVNLANAVNRGYSNTLKIKSPSRVFEKLSMYVPMGAANGIMKGIPIAVAAASDLANAIVDETASTMSTMAYVASDQYDFSPKITPVIDLNGTYDGMDRLESILADNPLSMSIRTSPSQRIMPQNATTYNFTNQNKNVVDAVNRLNDRITHLGEEITNMKMVLDTGVLVGQLTPGINSELGIMATREGRQ